MRAWGLAQGLSDNGVDVTVSINESFPQEISEHEGIFIENWTLNESFTHKINEYDSVIISYCMGDVSEFVAKNIDDDRQLILDVYVPIYVEVSARESNNVAAEFLGYMKEKDRYNKVLMRGDYFLCANAAQKSMYTGVLSSLGVINPKSYKEERIVIAPFGIPDKTQKTSENPYEKLGIDNKDFVVLWFGGLYPWFRIDEFLEAIKKLSKNREIKFVIVGSKNPFNSNPDFIRQHEKAYSYAVKNKLLDKSLYFVDWVDFNKRIDWYKNANLVISLNQPGDENIFSWRTRVMDYVWGDLVVITNGGDPLSDELIEKHAAIRLKDLSSSSIAETIKSIHNNKSIIAKAKLNIEKIKPNYYWSNITKNISKLIKNSDKLLPFRDNKQFAQEAGLDSGAEKKEIINKIKRLSEKGREYISKQGIKSTLKYGSRLLLSGKDTFIPTKQRRFVFLSHPIDNTGAPLVLMQIIKEFRQKHGAASIKVLAPSINDDNRKLLKKQGLKINKTAGSFSDKVVRYQMSLKHDDFVLINTIAVSKNYTNYVFDQLEKGNLKKAHWFIHEDKAQILSIAPGMLSKRNIKRISRLVNDGLLCIYVPSKMTQNEYNSIFHTQKVNKIPLRIEIDKRYKLDRKESEYEKIRFLLSGSPSDGRKGQLIAISALQKFLSDYYIKSPKLYRDFELHLLSIGSDYISQQIKWIGKSALGGKLKIYESMPYEEALKVAKKCNSVICCSLNETFALYVAEGMYMEHVILRNNTSGVDEQLIDGKNGLLINHKDVDDFAAKIEKLLNINSHSNAKLKEMGRTSQNIIEPYTHNTYMDKFIK